jgi:sugar phosphate isomerase/epimerase
VKEAGYDGVAGFAEWGWQEYIGRPNDFRRMLDDEGVGVASVDVGIRERYVRRQSR